MAQNESRKCAERRTGPCDVEKMSDATTVTKKRCPSATILIAARADLFTLKTKITAEKNAVSLHKTLLTHTVSPTFRSSDPSANTLPLPGKHVLERTPPKRADTFVIMRLWEPGALSAHTSRALPPALHLYVSSNYFRNRVRPRVDSAALLSMPAVAPQLFTQPVLEPVVVLTRTATLIAALARTSESDLDLDDNHQYEDESSDEFELSFEFDVIHGVWNTALKSTGKADDLCTTVLGTTLPSASATSLSSDAKIPPGVIGHGPLIGSLLRNMRDAQLQYPARTQTSPKRARLRGRENVSLQIQLALRCSSSTSATHLVILFPPSLRLPYIPTHNATWPP
ncbi:hypothetical protein B0H14DRAFT_3631835 [Mycena olivaceomarginata]|nr:hypothetical protein B0H14DRAFT_3631835 [Mycena olivaceomarginata]